MKNTRLVKIKTWDKMKKEFGLLGDGSIGISPCFNNDMEEAMPKNRIIEIKLHKFIDVTNHQWNGWAICDDMIKEIITPETYPQYFI